MSSPAASPLPGLEFAEPERTERRGPSADELLEGLNEPQRAAVVHAGGPLLVVAGAGSGKTRVLTRRIAWLISERQAHPGSVLAITFTNKAAAEMKERVEALVGKRARIMWVSTFHSACVRILRKEIDKLGFKSNFSIYDAADSKRLMALVVKDLDLDPRRYQPNAVLNWVSDHKNDLRDPEDAAKDTRNKFEEAYAAAYTSYQRRLREANALDFDDLIMFTVHLFQQFPEVRETYRRRFRHVLVDEYQDTNHAQYALIHQLCAESMEDYSLVEPVDGTPGDRVPPAELMVVGDADQSIYAFRGANIRNILDFEKDFPDATSILLEQNYRSTQTILNAANAVIGNNRGRKEKRLWSDAGDGDAITGYVADDEHDEARFVSEEIDRLTDAKDAKPSDVAVFYRTNAQSRVFEEVFIRVGMPYKVVGGVRFYERREIRDALAYLRMLVNSADEISLRRVLNTPRRGIGDRAEACVQALAERERITFWEALTRADEAPGLATRSLRAIQGFVGLVQELQSMVDAGERADVIVESVLERTGYLAELEESDDPQDATRVENLAELVAVAREFSDDPVAGPSADPSDVDAGTVAPGLGDFLERVALVADSDQIPDAPEGEDAGVVTLMTLHTAKGLEFPVVFLTGLEDGVFPHSRSLGDQPELEEERRLAYVGVTRAQRRLYVSRAMVRSAWGAPAHNPASRFLSELPVDLVDWRRTEAAQTSLGASGLVEPVTRRLRRPGPADRRGASQLLLGGAARRRRGQGQAGPRDPLAGARRPGGARLVRPRHGRGRRGRGRQDRRVDRLRVGGRQAAAAALRAGGEAIGVPVLGCAPGSRYAVARPRRLGRDGYSTWLSPRRQLVPRCRLLSSQGDAVHEEGLHGVHGVAAAGADLDVEVRAGAVAGRAHGADRLAAPDHVADAHEVRRLVAVPDLGAVIEGDDGLVAVGPVVAGLGDHAVGDGVDRAPDRGAEVLPGVQVGPEVARRTEAGAQVVAVQGRDPGVLRDLGGLRLGLLGELGQGDVALLDLGLGLGDQVLVDHVGERVARGVAADVLAAAGQEAVGGGGAAAGQGARGPEGEALLARRPAARPACRRPRGRRSRRSRRWRPRPGPARTGGRGAGRLPRARSDARRGACPWSGRLPAVGFFGVRVTSARRRGPRLSARWSPIDEESSAGRGSAETRTWQMSASKL